MAKVDRTVYKYHVTRANLWYPIGVHGLRVDYSEGAIGAIWLVSKHKLAWAVEHVCKRHNVRPQDVIVIRVRVRRSWLRRNKVKGAWYCVRDILPCRIEWVKNWYPLSLSIAKYGAEKLFIFDNRQLGFGVRYGRRARSEE